MEKLNRIRVLAPLNLVLYIGALWLTWFFPGWGCAALGVADIVTIVGIHLITKRYVEQLKISSWQQMAPRLVVPYALLCLLAIVHLGGAAVGAFLGNDLLQHVVAYGSVTFAVLGVIVYGSKKGKTLYWDN